MASEQTLEERTISGTGLVRIPDEDIVYRVYTLFVEVLRPPKTPFLNLKSNPPEGFFGRVTCVKDDVVYQVFDIKFPEQAWEFNPDITMQTLTSVKCQYKGVLQTFVNLGNALNLLPFSVTDTIKDFKPLTLPFTEFRIVCYATTALKVTLKALTLDVCDGDDAKPQKPPTPPPKTPKPPNEPYPVPPDTPINIDPPYDDNDNITDPAPIDDDFEEPPIGEAGTIYTVAFDFTYQTAGGSFNDGGSSTNVWAPVSQDVHIDGNKIVTNSRGNANQPIGSFGETILFLLGGGAVFTDVRNVTITLVP